MHDYEFRNDLERDAHIVAQRKMPIPDAQSPKVTPIPALDLTRELYAAVTRSVDEDVSSTVALEKLQHRVLLACARFECAAVIV